MAQRAARSAGSVWGKLWRQQQQQQQLWRQEIPNTKISNCVGAAERAAVGQQLRRFAPSERFLQKPGSSKRFYYTDAQGVSHFKRRGPSGWVRESPSGGRSQQSILIVLVVAGAGSAYVYYNNLQVVPYTHRKHFVLIGPEMERMLGEQEFVRLKKELSAKILPPIHPLSIRVRAIARDVIQAAMQGTNAEDWGEVESPPVAPGRPRNVDPRPALGLGHDHGHGHGDDAAPKSSEDVYGNEKLDDDMWVDKSRQKGLDQGTRAHTAHLNKLKWEVIVVDDDIMNAFCLPGGKIVVFTGLLKHFHADVQVATVLGHEVGHVVARHVAEKLTQGIWLGFFQLVVLSFVYVPGLVSTTSELLLKLPFSRRMEMEADHIGLMLMAAAGYDPRLAPAFYEKMGALSKQSEYLQYVTTHPSGKKRADSLRVSNTMQEALLLYQQKLAAQDQDLTFTWFL